MSHLSIAPVPLWQAAPAPSAARLAAVHACLNLHPAVARIVARRVPEGVNLPEWLNPLKMPFCDPFALNDMEQAVTRLRTAIEQRQRILIFGDYDTDGITATALMMHALTACGATVSSFIPDRETEGYGLTPAAITRCLSGDVQPHLLITVDCGISSVAEIADLKARGIDVIVTDHHVPPETLPADIAIVNPRLKAPKGAENMCGCATAYTLIRALYTHFPALNHKQFLDLVAVATIADVMELTGENRSLVTKGLYILAQTQHGNPGLHALANAQNLDFHALTAEQVAFKLVPCINAASRIGDCACARHLLNLHAPGDKWTLLPDEVKNHCQQAATALVEANQTRRKIEAELRDCIKSRNPQPSGNLILVAGTREEGFHPGVLGIVAARLSEEFGLPAAVCCITPTGGGSGSVRSRGAWHAVHALDTVSDLLEHYGGHAAASGFALKDGAFEAFRTRFPKAFDCLQVSEEPILFDETLDETINEDLLTALDKLEPFGAGNPKPRFAKTVILNAFRAIGADKTHLDLTLTDPNHPTEAPLRAVWFGAASRAATWERGMRLRILFTVARDKHMPSVPSLNLVDAYPVQ